MFHDFGAYKIEERDGLEEFVVMDPHGHAVYGSLFFAHYSPVPEEAFALHLADRICILLSKPPFDAQRLRCNAGTAC